MAKKIASQESRAKKRGISLRKVVRVDLPHDDAWAMYQVLDAFFKRHGVQHGTIDIEMSGYDGYVEGIAVSATVTKSEEEIEAEILAHDVQDEMVKEKARKAKEKAEKKDYEEYLRLHDKFGKK